MNEIKITIEGLKELTEAINQLAGAVPAQAGQQTATTYQTPMQPQPYPTYTTAPIVPAAPVGQMLQTNTVVPTNAVPQQFTQDQLAIAATGLVDQGKQPILMGILAKYGAQTLVQVPTERYGELAMDLRGAGANI